MNVSRTFLLTPYTKINPKWIKDLNVRPENIKPLDVSIGRTLFDINHSNIFLDLSTKGREIKAKIHKWDLVRHKAFAQQRKPSTKRKDSLLNGRKYLLMI